MKNKIFLSVVLIFTLVLPMAYISAATFLPENMKDSEAVVVSGDKEYRNLYLAGGTVVVNQKILGDLFSVGSNVHMAGEVEDDLFILGGNITVSNLVSGDARIAGGNISINAPILGDLLVAGGTITTSQISAVTGDLWVLGEVVNINNPVSGNTKIAGGEVYINNTISGDLEVNASRKLTFGPGSEILGNVVYFGEKDPIIEEGAQLGAIERKTIQQKDSNSESVLGFILSLVMKVLTLFVTALVLWKLFSKRLQMTFANYDLSLSLKFWQTVLIGFLCLIFVPIVSLILLVSMIGVYLGMILFVVYLLTILLSIVLSVFVMSGAVQKFQKRNSDENNSTVWDFTWKTILVGALVLGVLSLVPVLGWLVLALIFMSVFGNTVVTFKERVVG